MLHEMLSDAGYEVEIQSDGHAVLPLEMVDKSTSPLQTHFRPVFVSRQSGQAL